MNKFFYNNNFITPETYDYFNLSNIFQKPSISNSNLGCNSFLNNNQEKLLHTELLKKKISINAVIAVRIPYLLINFNSSFGPIFENNFIPELENRASWCLDKQFCISFIYRTRDCLEIKILVCSTQTVKYSNSRVDTLYLYILNWIRGTSLNSYSTDEVKKRLDFYRYNNPNLMLNLVDIMLLTDQPFYYSEYEWCLLSTYANFLYKNKNERNRSKSKIRKMLIFRCNNKYIMRWAIEESTFLYIDFLDSNETYILIEEFYQRLGIKSRLLLPTHIETRLTDPMLNISKIKFHTNDVFAFCRYNIFDRNNRLFLYYYYMTRTLCHWEVNGDIKEHVFGDITKTHLNFMEIRSRLERLHSSNQEFVTIPNLELRASFMKGAYILDFETERGEKDDYMIITQNHVIDRSDIYAEIEKFDTYRRNFDLICFLEDVQSRYK